MIFGAEVSQGQQNQRDLVKVPKFRSPPPLPTILLAGRHLPKTRGGKKGQIHAMIRFLCFFGGTGDNRMHQFQRSLLLTRSRLSCCSIADWKEVDAPQGGTQIEDLS